MVLANWYFKGVGRLKLQFLVPIQCFTLCTTARNHCALFVFFSFLCSLSSHCTFTSVFEIFKSPMAIDFPRVIIITSVLFGRSKASSILTMSIQKICHKGLLHLQKIVSQPFSANHEPHTLIANLNIYRNGMCVIMDVRKETSMKKLYLQKEKD